MKAPRLSIIVPNYNYGRFFSRLAASLGNQTLGLDIVELILVDDGSTDNSLDLMLPLENLPLQWFRLIESEHTGRPGLVRNLGLQAARGEYILCMDPDDMLSPGFASICIAALEHNSEHHLAYTDYMIVENGESREIKLPDFDPQLLKNQNIFPSTALFRRELLERVDGYRANTDYEDWDFWIQAVHAGCTAIHIPTPLYVQIMHGSNFSNTARENDAPAKAQIVLNNPGFFSNATKHWAKAVIAGEVWAYPFPRGIIPITGDVEKLLKTTAFSRESHMKR